MGFSLKQMIEELECIARSDMKPKRKQKELEERLQWWKEYAEDCGQLN